ncbi:hypothetical protein GCK72_015482 [Caenorhabditis remanei]|uniref:Uncharacterized protein n=1 Tax=Caenorhabditis remanei TaxID=31234 RepID=A0A6A5GXC7_CAERE|nr:hypothetical protein GCK72_015482 [Caenorhabditis remanei]KAF1759022.1 hypothetical protein GCK72_015482 [Caenorhabditis remanei]
MGPNEQGFIHQQRFSLKRTSFKIERKNKMLGFQVKTQSFIQAGTVIAEFTGESVDISRKFLDATAERSVHYSLFKDGSTSVSNVPQTGQFIVKAPHNTIIQIETRRFTGRHEKHEAIQINVEEKMSHMNHEDIRKLTENLKAHGKASVILKSFYYTIV